MKPKPEETFFDATGHIDAVGQAMIVDGHRIEGVAFKAALSHLERCALCGERVAEAALESASLHEVLRPRAALAPLASAELASAELASAEPLRARPRAMPAIALGLGIALLASVPLWIDAVATLPEDFRVARTVFVVTLRALVSMSRSTDEFTGPLIVSSTFAAMVFSTVGIWIARRSTRGMKVGGEA